MVILLGACELVPPLHDEKEVGMRQTPLLEFHHINISPHLAQDVLLKQLILEFLQLLPENTNNEIWTVLRCLTGVEFLPNLIPVWVACHCEEDVRLAILSN